MKSRSQLTSWQCYISLIRIASISYALGYWACQVEFEPLIRPLNAHSISAFVFGAIVLLNDAFILITDHQRTDTYMGCVVTQVAMNCSLSSLIVLHTVLDAQWRFFEYFNYSGYSMAAAFEIFVLFGGLCSLGLMSISLWPIFALRSYVPLQQLWKVNTKDAFVGMILPVAGPRTLSVLGHPREKTIPFPRVLAVLGRFVKVRLAHCLFRRIRPAETRVYAFTRNSFAIVAIGILIFRTIAALQRAQTEIGTRVTSRACDFSPKQYISILSDRLIYDSDMRISFPDVNITVSLVMPWTIGGASYNVNTIDCSSIGWSWMYTSAVDYYGAYQNRTLELFECHYAPSFSFGGRTPIGQEYAGAFPYYRINVQPVATTSQIEISDVQMPRIWLLDSGKLSLSSTSNWSEVGEVQMYLPPLELLRGSHITAKANLIIRRFLKSSIVKDIIFNFKPEYKSLSLYPIVESSVVPLNASDVNLATANIRPALAPGLMYHRNRVDTRNIDYFSKILCDYIEDYRSGTMIDVIGSVGGVFALLQVIHLLLFGRPLLWGLTGAKMITPFGLLGQCSSRSFKRRLKEGYHATSSEDGTETIRIVKFLQDFVIDFGPANVDLEQRPASPAPVNNDTQT